MSLTLEELTILIDAVGTLIAEYGDRPERVELETRLRIERARRRDEIARHTA